MANYTVIQHTHGQASFDPENVIPGSIGPAVGNYNNVYDAAVEMEARKRKQGKGEKHWIIISTDPAEMNLDPKTGRRPIDDMLSQVDIKSSNVYDFLVNRLGVPKQEAQRMCE